MGSCFCSFQCYQQPGLDWAGLGAAGGGFYFLPSPVNEVMQARGLEQGTAEGTHPSPPNPDSLLPRNLSREPLTPSHSAVFINFAARAGDPHTHTPIAAPHGLLPSPTLSSPHAWIRYIPPALPDVSIPSSPDRAIIYQVVSRVVGEGGPGGRGFVSSLCWSSTGPSSLVSSQLLRVAGVREQMLKGLPFICGLILLPFHFILPASGMLLAYTSPHPPCYHSAWTFGGSRSSFSMCLSPLRPSAASPVTSTLSRWQYFLPLAFFSSLNVRYHKPNLVKGQVLLVQPILSLHMLWFIASFYSPCASEMSNYLEHTTIKTE